MVLNDRAPIRNRQCESRRRRRDATDRGVSTALDTLLFVLLVGAAIALFAGVQPSTPTTDSAAEETGDVLSTSTATVSYSWSPSIRVSGERETVTVTRRAHGTYAELLATAATTNPRWDARGTTGTGASLTRAAVTATEAVLPSRDALVQVRAVWFPFPESTLAGTVVVGETPPPDASVQAATVTVPSGFPNVTDAALEAGRRGSFYGVANATASGVVRGLFPAGPTADALRSEGPDYALAAYRYRQFSETLGVDVAGTLDAGDVDRANDRLTNALAAELVAGLRDRYDSAIAAARAVSVHEVTVVVRTWSP